MRARLLALGYAAALVGAAFALLWMVTFALNKFRCVCWQGVK